MAFGPRQVNQVNVSEQQSSYLTSGLLFGFEGLSEGDSGSLRMKDAVGFADAVAPWAYSSAG